MNNYEVQKLVEEISIEYFAKPFRHHAIFNQRLRTTGGRYLLHNHNIELNKKYLEQFGKEELIGIIKHELCHYHLHIEGRGYKHSDRDFKWLLHKVEAPRYCSTLPETVEKRKKQKILTYLCIECSQAYTRKRKLDTKKYVCGRCRGKLALLEE